MTKKSAKPLVAGKKFAIGKMKIIAPFLVAIVVIPLVAFALLVARQRANAVQLGTTLTATSTADYEWTRVFTWGMQGNAQPAQWNLFRGDSGTTRTSFTVTKDQGTETVRASGNLCVTNTGSAPTQHLAGDIVLRSMSPAGELMRTSTTTLDFSINDTLRPNETYCFPFSAVNEFMPGAIHRYTISVTIDNYFDYQPFSPNCPGADPCPHGPDIVQAFDLPTSPTIENDQIHVTDTLGHAWTFQDSGTASFDTTFSCNADNGNRRNAITITEPGQRIQSVNADVNVSCTDLQPKQDVSVNFKRKGQWTVAKSVTPSSVTLASAQATGTVSYLITTSASGTDSGWMVTGTVAVKNPATVPAVIKSVAYSIAGTGAVSLACGTSTFPLTLNGGDTLNCAFSANLPDASTRTALVNATIQNFSYSSSGQPTPTLTTDYPATYSIDFTNVPVAQTDACMALSDSLKGSLGNICLDDLIGGSKTFAYNSILGPYATCGMQQVANVVTGITSDSAKTVTSQATVSAGYACSGGGVNCVQTREEWKKDAGYKKYEDKVSAFLPIQLGNGGGLTLVVQTASQAIEVLSKKALTLSGDPIASLYAELLAAKLNIRTGASHTPISGTIISADAFISGHTSWDWSKMLKTEKSNVNDMDKMLENFNKGKLGVDSCKEKDHGCRWDGTCDGEEDDGHDCQYGDTCHDGQDHECRSGKNCHKDHEDGCRYGDGRHESEGHDCRFGAWCRDDRGKACFGGYGCHEERRD